MVKSQSCQSISGGQNDQNQNIVKLKIPIVMSSKSKPCSSTGLETQAKPKEERASVADQPTQGKHPFL